MRRPLRDAFTIVELLVVIGVIAVLLAILIPSLNKARATAQQVACASNMRQLGIGFQMYCDQNKGQLPQSGPNGSDANANAFAPSGGVTGIDDPSLWFNAVPAVVGAKSYYQLLLYDQAGLMPAPTTGVNSVFICPGAKGPATQLGGLGRDVLTPDGKYFLLYGTDSNGKLKPITTPGPGPFLKFNLSYVMNGSITATIANPQSSSRVMLSRLGPGSTFVLLMEKLANPGEYLDPGVQQYIATNHDLYAGLATSAGFVSNIGQPKGNWKRFTTRHMGGGNILFADGHVARLAWRDTQIQPGQVANRLVSDANQPNRIVWSIAGPVN